MDDEQPCLVSGMPENTAKQIRARRGGFGKKRSVTSGLGCSVHAVYWFGPGKPTGGRLSEEIVEMDRLDFVCCHRWPWKLPDMERIARWIL